MFCHNAHLPQSCSALYPLFLASTANGTGKLQWIHFHLLEVEVICLMNIADGWMVAFPLPPPPVSTKLSVMVLIMIRLMPVACSVRWWISAKLKQAIVLVFYLLGFPQHPELDGRVELDIFILQSTKCWSVTEARQEGRVYFLLCEMYASREM